MLDQFKNKIKLICAIGLVTGIALCEDAVETQKSCVSTVDVSGNCGQENKKNDRTVASHSNRTKKTKKRKQKECGPFVAGGLTILTAGAIAGTLIWASDNDCNNTNSNHENSAKIEKIALPSIFEYVVGTPENATTPIVFSKNTDGRFFIQNSTCGKKFCCGNIEHSTLENLRDNLTKKIPAQKSEDKPSFTVICYTNKDKSRFDEADICALQANPENRDAVFQLASRMHGLEGGCVSGGELTRAELGFNRMLHGPTQGEYASFSAAPGTIYKMYGYGPINFLSGTPLEKFIDPKKSGGGMPDIEQIATTTKLDDDWTNNLNIYFHSDIEVVAGRKLPDNSREIIKPNQLVNQIPVAAFDWRMSSNVKFDGKCKVKSLHTSEQIQLRTITGQMLNGFYEGTLLYSVLKNKNKIFLTAVGGGAFQNDRDLIIAAISNNTNFNIIQSRCLNVTLVIHEQDKKNIDEWKKGMNNFWSGKGVQYEFKEL